MGEWIRFLSAFDEQRPEVFLFQDASHYQIVDSFVVKSTSEYETRTSPQCLKEKPQISAAIQTAEKGELPTISDNSF